MSSGLEMYESTVASYGTASAAIKGYTANYDTDFFRNWTESHNLKMEKLKSAMDVSSGVGLGTVAAKLGYGVLKKRFGKKKTEDEGEGEEGEGEGEEETFEGFGDEAGEAGEGGAPAATDAAEETFEGFGDAADAGTGAAGAGAGAGAPAADAAEETFEGFGDAADVGDVAVVAPTIGAPLSGAPVATDATIGDAGIDSDLVANVAAGGDAQAAALTQNMRTPDPTVDNTVDRQEGGTEEGGTEEPGAGAGEGEGEGGTEGAAGAGEGDALITPVAEAAGEEAGAGILSAVGDAALAVGAVASEVIPIVGIFASVGIGLYELFHHPHKAPAAPALSTASSRGEMVLPSFDSVVDTPASSSAF